MSGDLHTAKERREADCTRSRRSKLDVAPTKEKFVCPGRAVTAAVQKGRHVIRRSSALLGADRSKMSSAASQQHLHFIMVAVEKDEEIRTAILEDKPP